MGSTSGRRGRPGRRAAAVGVVLALAAGAGCSSSDDPEEEGSRGASDPSPTTAAPPAAARPSEGCGTDPAVAGPVAEVPGDVPLTLDVGGTQRTYRLGVPASYSADEPAPLALGLHGAGSNAFQASFYSELPARAGARGFVTVTPDAIGGRWEVAPEGVDDDFLMAVLDDVERSYCIDRARVHVVGMSLGAWKATVTACAHPDRFASVALVTEEVRPGACPPLPVVAFHGTADRSVPYGEGAYPGVVVTGSNAGLSGTRDNIASWAEGGGCDADRQTRRIGTDVEVWTYSGCDEGIDVELYTIEGGGHTWPGADFKRGPPEETTETIDATEIILDWFEAHPG
jgi:polyhydroxybutyrate depolymerase